MAMSSKGLIITVEGIEGAGKSTLARGLAASVEKTGLSVVLTAEPGATPLGQAIRRLLLNPQCPPPVPMAELMLFVADRAQHVAEVIAPALEAGKVVICDRFSDSSIAYQGAGRGLDNAWVKQVCERVSLGLNPQLTFLIDLPVTEALRRAEGTDRIEREVVEFHERVRRGFLAIAKAEPERVKLLDGTLNPSELLAQAWRFCQPIIEKCHASGA